MYKYFSELEELRNFKVYLARASFDKKQDLFISNITFSDDLLKEIGNLFPKLYKIDGLIIALNEVLMMRTPEYNLLSYEGWLSNGEFFRYRDECYLESHYKLRENIKLSAWDLYCVLMDIYQSIDYLVDFYPNYKEFLLSTNEEIEMILDEFKIKSTVEIPPKSDGVIVNWPNSWYITPNGYLYNTGFGHKRGNLIYSFEHIYDCLNYNRRVPNINYYRNINEILKRGYVTYDEFRNYSHLVYKLPTISTPEVDHDRERYKNIIEIGKEEYKKIVTSFEIEWPKPERSYQKNLITLIIGHLAAETSLYSSFLRMNESCCKKEMFTKLRYMTVNDLSDLLIRFSGFHKIESIVDNTITTCSLNGITEFSEYLKKGWNLHIIPGIVYDKSEEKLSEVDFNSYFVSKHLDEELGRYEGKGKILIKDKWFS